jgi:hypothetical protein
VTDPLHSALLASRRWLRVKRAARAGLLAEIMQERSRLRRDEAEGRLGAAADRRLVLEELEQSLAELETKTIGALAKWAEEMQAR